MAIHDVWLANLKTLVAWEGGGRKGIRSVADAAGLSEEYVYQLVMEKPNKDGMRREVGVSAAKKIAKGLGVGKPDGWFDLIVLDEAHRYVESLPGQLDERASKKAGVESSKIVGMTATTTPPDHTQNPAFPLAVRAGGAMDLGVVIDELASAMLRTDPVDRAAAKAYLIGLCDAPDRLDLRDKIRATLEPPPAAQKPTPETGAKRAA